MSIFLTLDRAIAQHRCQAVDCIQNLSLILPANYQIKVPTANMPIFSSMGGSTIKFSSLSTLLTSSPSSYDSTIPSKWLSPPCSTCTGHTAPRCTPCTQRWPPAAAAPPARSPPHQPPPSWRPVVRPACCHNYPPPPLLRSHVTYRRMPAGASLQEMCTR